MNPVTFSALAEPNRLHIVELLKDNPRSVNEIVDTLKLHQPQVSKHLKFLTIAGLVEVHPLAQKRFYALRPEKLKEIDLWIQKYRKLWDERFNRLDEILKKKDESSNF